MTRSVAPLLLLVMLAVSGVGCAAKAPKAAKESAPEPSKKPEDQVVPQGNVMTGPGKTTRYPVSGPRSPEWTAEWEQGKIKVEDEGVSQGQMSTVKGEVMRQGKRIATYQAKEATMSKKTNVLALRGDVTITSFDPKGTLNCRQLEYHPDRAAFRAWGPIRVESPQGTMQTDGQMWFSDDLKSFGGASMFPEVKKS